MASTDRASPTGDRSSGTMSPTHTVDVEKNGATDAIKLHDDGTKVSPTGPVTQSMFGEKREQYRSEEDYMYEQQKRSEGDHKFHRLGWKKLTICLLVEAIALGALSIPSAFATLGMVAGVIICVGMGLIAIYTSFIVGQVKVKFPQVSHYADAGQLMTGGSPDERKSEQIKTKQNKAGCSAAESKKHCIISRQESCRKFFSFPSSPGTGALSDDPRQSRRSGNSRSSPLREVGLPVSLAWRPVE